MTSPRTLVRTLLLSVATLSAVAGVARAEATSPAPDEPAAPEVSPPAPAPPPPPSPDEERTPVTVAVLYPLATNAGRPNVTSSFDLSLLYGRVGQIEGLQLGAVVAHAARGVDGAQIGSVLAVSNGRTTGTQIAGAFNVTTDQVIGAQLAPINVAGPVDGVQLGVVNVGRRVRGVQLGLVNVADEVDGAAIGLVSISRDSVHPVVWASNLQYINAGVKFATKYVFTMLGAHYGTHEADFDNVGATLAIGARLPLPASFDLELQGSFTQLAPWPQRKGNRDNTWIAPQVVAGHAFAPRLRAFVGGGVRLPITVEIGRDVSRPEVFAGLQF